MIPRPNHHPSRGRVHSFLLPSFRLKQSLKSSSRQMEGDLPKVLISIFPFCMYKAHWRPHGNPPELLAAIFDQGKLAGSLLLTAISSPLTGKSELVRHHSPSPESNLKLLWKEACQNSLPPPPVREKSIGSLLLVAISLHARTVFTHLRSWEAFFASIKGMRGTSALYSSLPEAQASIFLPAFILPSFMGSYQDPSKGSRWRSTVQCKH